MGIQINGNTNNINAGIGSLSIEDINELDIVGVATAANFKTGVSNLHSVGLTLSGGQIDVGSNIKIGTAGVATASNFKTGSSNLHSTGLTVGNALVHSTGINVGTGATVHSPASNVLTLGTNSNERVRIDSAGNLSLGKGSASSTGYGRNFQIHHDGTSGASLHLTDNNTGSGNGDGFHIISTSQIAYLWQRENANMVFGTNGSARWNIYGSNGHLAPNADSTFDIGTSSVRVRNGYFDTLYGDGSNLTGITGTTINNNANDRVITGSASANTLEGEANLTFETSTSGGTLTVAGTSEYQIKLKDSNTSGNGAETALAFTDSGNTVQGFVGYNYWGDGNIDLQNNNSGGSVCINTGGGNERLVVTSDGDIYGPSGGRKNWFDNGSFDCTYGGRKANVSMDYGNHHAYGWVTDRFMSRNAVQWSRSSNVPTGKGFSYSTLTNGAGGTLMQAVELPDYGDMGVFTPGSYWCVSVWSTAGLNHSTTAFSYDLGSTKTDIPGVGSGTYATTGETASGTSTGTFNRYYRVYGPMPSSIISTATAAYWTWGFSAQGYATGFQLERVPTSTSKPTPYEHVHPSVTINRCRRYAYRKYNSRHVSGWKRHDANVNWEARHPVLPTHMPSGSNQSADPYGVIMHTAGSLTNFQSTWQNPAVTSLSRYGFNPADGSFILNGQSNYSGTHIVIPSYEGFEYEVQHGFF